MSRRATAIVLAAALLARLAVLVPAARRPLDDPDNYRPLARSIAEGRGFSHRGRPTAYRPPLYPLALAPIEAIFGRKADPAILSLHLVLGLATAGLTTVAARRLGLSERQATVAGLIVALDPVLVAQGRAVMTETLAALLVAWSLAMLSGRSRWLGGFALGLGVLCRPSLLPGACLVVLARAAAGAGSARRRLAAALPMLVALGLTPLPWAARNWVALGVPVATTTHGGYTLALANNDYYYDDVLNGPPGAVWSGAGQRAWAVSISRATSGMGEPSADRWLSGSALRTIAARPRDFARASLARLGRFWGVVPSGSVYPGPLRWATAAWTIPLWGLVALGAGRRGAWRWPMVAAPMLIVGLSAVHAAYWTDLRMRAPAVPALALVASLGVTKKFRRDPDFSAVQTGRSR